MDAINWHSFFFYLFAVVTCAFAVGVVVSNNVVRMAFHLIVSLGATAGLFFLANAPFVGAMQIMIYVGGTLVLLVFGVMLTAQGPFVSLKTRSGEWVLGLLLGGALLAVLVQTAFSVTEWQGQKAPGLAYATGTTYAANGADAQVTFQASAAGTDLAGTQVQLQAAADSRTAVSVEYTERPPRLIVRFREGMTAAELVSQFHHEKFTAMLPPGSTGAGRVSAKDFARLAMKAPPAESDTTLLGLALLGARPDAAGQGVQSGYLLPFEIVSVHLLVVLIGAAYLARTKKRAASR